MNIRETIWRETVPITTLATVNYGYVRLRKYDTQNIQRRTHAKRGDLSGRPPSVGQAPMTGYARCKSIEPGSSVTAEAISNSTPWDPSASVTVARTLV